MSTQLSQAGFTLLEILITSILAAVILMALWSLSDIYLKLFASGKKKIEETQIVRGVTQQFAKDVSQVIQLPQDPPQSSHAGTSSSPFGRSGTQPAQVVVSQPAVLLQPNSPPNTFANRNVDRTETSARPMAATPQPQSDRLAPQFGLFGTKQALRLILLQARPQTAREATDLAEILPQPGQPRLPVASELRTIEYSFAWSTDGQTNERQHPPGLLRREWAWETWSGRWQASHVTSGSMTASQMLPDQQSEWTDEDAVGFETERDISHVPQVTGLEFRYYDGDRWETEWNSWERHRLPSLVEMLLRVNTKRDERHSHEAEPLPDDTETSLSLSNEGEPSHSTTGPSNQGTVYRQLVQLPVADGKAAPEMMHAPQSSVPQSKLADINPQPGRRQP